MRTSKRSQQNVFLTLTLMVALAAILGATLVLWNQYSDPRVTAIKVRAARIFALDSSAQNRKLPLQKLAALSIALEFGNYQGAEALVGQLEKATLQN